MTPLRVLEALHSFSDLKMFSLVKEAHCSGVTELPGKDNVSAPLANILICYDLELIIPTLLRP